MVVAVCGFGAFLYFIPPFFITPPEDFGKAMADAAPAVTDIADPAERAIAARGRYIVMTTGCIGCHATNGPQGPDLTKYLAGGGAEDPDAARHLRQPQPDAGPGDRARAPDRRRGEARAAQRHVPRRPRRARHRDAVAGVLELERRGSPRRRRLPPAPEAVRHRIPEPVPGNAITIPGAIEQDYAGKDYGDQVKR